MEKPGALAQSLTFSALVLLLTLMIFSSVQMFGASKAMQQTGRDYAEARHVRYGLLSVNRWSEKLTTLIDESFTQFTKSPELQSRLKPPLTKMLNTILIRFEDRARAKHAELTILGVHLGDLFGARFADEVQRLKLILIDGLFEQFRRQVPMLVDLVVAELVLMHPQTVSEFAKGLSAWMKPQGLHGIEPRLTVIAKRYECRSVSDVACQKQIALQQQRERSSVNIHGGIVLVCSLIACVLMATRKKHMRQLEMLLSLGIGTSLWFSGILIPMISLEVSLDALSFRLGNATIAFQDQVLFYQNKSIVDVVSVLLTHEQLSTKIVGSMVALFSVVFPLLKIVGLSRMFVVPEGVRVSRFTYFFAMESSKYSMADVFVIALFMAYIGLDGLVGGQLEQLRDSRGSSTEMVLGAQGAQFEMGLFLFTGFCFFSIFLGRWVSKMRAEYPIRVAA